MLKVANDEHLCNANSMLKVNCQEKVQERSYCHTPQNNPGNEHIAFVLIAIPYSLQTMENTDIISTSTYLWCPGSLYSQ